MSSRSRYIERSRGIVIDDYNSAAGTNGELFDNGDVKASSEYIFPNQKEDAIKICNKFYENNNIRAISIIKRTKVGMDGLMIEISKNMATHPDDNFVLHRNNIFIITGMSNKSWEEDMKYKMPNCFKDNVYHHGRLQKIEEKLKNIKDAMIIIDEIDNGDKDDQKLHRLLKKSGILTIKYMEEQNIRLVFVSATMINELLELEKWGDKHFSYNMTIPPNYIGHKEFLELGIIQEFYPIDDDKSAEKWVQEDILQNYGSDYRVHIIRTDNKNINFISEACKKNNIKFKNHTSDDRINHEELSNIFNDISNHLVIAIKGFYRRANLIPNKWKLKIGATHERYCKKYDTSVQIQGLPGRMSGYWKQELLNGHKTGPHRTSIESINQYEEFYKNPLAKTPYNTNSKKTFLQPKCVNLKIDATIDDSVQKTKKDKREPTFIDFKDHEYCRTKIKTFVIERAKKRGIQNSNLRGPRPLDSNKNKDENGFYHVQLREKKFIMSREEAKTDKNCNINNGAEYALRPYYTDKNDPNTLHWLFIHYCITPEYDRCPCKDIESDIKQ